MSKVVYLKDEQKEKVLDLIKKYLAFRLTDEEILDNLKTKKSKLVTGLYDDTNKKSKKAPVQHFLMSLKN